MIEHWGSKGESIHLRFGGEYHTALQDYDIARAKGETHNRAIHIAVGSLMERTIDFDPDVTTKAGKYKNRSTLVGLVIDYLDHYGADDPAETYIRPDGKPAVELSFRFELDFGPGNAYIPDTETKAAILADGDTPNQPYLLCGHLDRVVNFNDQLLVMDHKTTVTTLGDNFFDQWEPSNQMTLYTLAGKVVLDAPIRGVVISGAQIMLEQPNRFVRGFTYRTQDQLDEWLYDLSILLRTNEAYAAANHWPMNDTSCDKFGGCRFRGICSKAPSVRQNFLAADFTKLSEEEAWNPLRPR